MTFGQYIKQLRTDKAYSQPELALKMNVEQSYLSKLENDKSVPSNDVFRKLLAALDMDIAAFMQGIKSSGMRHELRQIPDIEMWSRAHSNKQQLSRKQWLSAAIISISFGGALLFSGHEKIFFPETQYEYVSAGVLLDGEPLQVFANWATLAVPFEEQDVRDKVNQYYKQFAQRRDPKSKLLFTYRGESFVETDAQGRRFYEEETNKRKQVIRSENAWMQFLGVFSLIAGVTMGSLQRAWFKP
ncbi:helix-turn-helix domain-containing protein [Pseudoalteromonas xiamenensis]|uniref:Helix-turn-helix transcriptional regulator n=1 Tax=Pseudoalteromonas xiamenensis TaxID=882626 RepID=A0A975HLB2_9GAMM|nr:helix-turn-helix transcriptional regulator [Pseudoalteromonas xiamenensis]QTH71903.1 helix-turn-helix transcriptional regulator [Pseudoalteromonas xiamenensis]